MMTREPGGTAIGEKIRDLLLDRKYSEMTDMAELLLYAAARAQLAREAIEPALESGKHVICDRWVDSSLVYQGVAREMGDAVSAVNLYAAAGLFRPDATILLDMDPREAMARAAKNEGGDRIEAFGVEYQTKVRDGYLKLAARDKERFRVIDAAGSPEDVFSRVRETLETIVGAEARDG